jgi:pilus assembly protein CpaE
VAIERDAPTTVAIVGASRRLTQLRHALSERVELAVVDGPPAGRAVHAVLLELVPDGVLADELAAVREATAAPVVCLLPDASAATVDEALDAGVADVLVHPYDTGGVVFAIEKAVRAHHQQGKAAARVITVFSPKGGTGKSVIASNLATTLALRGVLRTILVDLDLQFGDAAIMLGLSPKNTVRELLLTPAGLDAETLEVYTDRHSSGLELLAAPGRPEEAELVGHDAIRAVLNVARATHDVVVADTSPFFDGSTLASLDLTTDLLLVCTPDIPTVKNVRLALETLELLALPTARTRVVLNRDGEVSGLSKAEVENALERSVDFTLAFDPAVQRGVNRGVPAVLNGPEGAFTDGLTGLAQSLFPEAWPQVAPAPRRRLQRLMLAAGRV